MRVFYFFSLFLLLISLVYTNIYSYTLPGINLGLSSILDGGPLRQKPGWYLQAYNQFYHTNRFLDHQGKLLINPSPHFNLLATSLQLTYQSQNDFFGLGTVGIDITQPIVWYSHVTTNPLGIISSGGGLGDLSIGVYAQGDAIFRNNQPFYVHRLEFVASFPTGKDKRPLLSINPGNGVFYINPYWAATLYFTPKFSASWRLHYLWVATNHTTHIKAGDAIHLNYALEYALSSRFYIGINGYFLQQIKDSTFFGAPIPNSRERVLAIGPGFLYALEKEFNLVMVGNLFCEMAVKNRPQGIKAVLRILKHF